MKSKAEVMRDLGRVRRRKIAIQKQTDIEDEWGNVTKDWADWQTIWVERSSLWGKAYYAARAVNEQNTVEFTARHVAFLDEVDTVNFRVVFDGEVYDIKHIDRLKDDGQWIKFRCLEAGASG